MPVVQRLTIEQAHQKMVDHQLTYIDIRDEVSYQHSHIVNAVHLTNLNLTEFLTTAVKTYPVIVYCYHGHSSLAAADYLIQHGFEEVYSMDGGFEAWRLRFPISRMTP